MRKKKVSFIVVIFAALVLSAVFWVGSVWQRIYYNPAAAEEPAPLPAKEKSILNVLILGLDGDGGRGRADTVMIVSINQNTGQLAVISVPRDARVNIPGRGPGKLNHAMTGKGEITLMKQTLEQLFGEPVHHYISTDFGGFANIIDLLGGVTIDVEKRMVHTSVNRPPIDLYPGLQRLDGRQALGYVRYRGDAAGDFGRMQRQQQFLKAVAAEVLQVQSLFKLPRLLEEAARHVRTDLSLPQVLEFGRFAVNLDLAAVEAVTLQGRGVTIGGVSYVALDEAQLEETVRRYLRWEKEDAPAPKQNREAGT
ncbi:MAG: Regulatory protein MsrR [Syntrophomonadaceae bacterium]|nr:Regulatory protein MsrR [Bacillota bacterium]